MFCLFSFNDIKSVMFNFGCLVSGVRTHNGWMLLRFWGYWGYLHARQLGRDPMIINCFRSSSRLSLLENWATDDSPVAPETGWWQVRYYSDSLSSTRYLQSAIRMTIVCFFLKNEIIKNYHLFKISYSTNTVPTQKKISCDCKIFVLIAK